MINYVTKNIWESEAEYIVVAVNCEGISDSQLMKEFEQKYPRDFSLYQEYCRERHLYQGDFWWCSDKVCLAITKNKSTDITSISLIEEILQSFRKKIASKVFSRYYTSEPDLHSYAFPKLGCDEGFDWHSEIEPLMNKHLGYLKNQIYFHV